jgi:hypothetical protein
MRLFETAFGALADARRRDWPMKDVRSRPLLAAALLALCAAALAQTNPATDDRTRKAMTTTPSPSAAGGLFTLGDLKPLLPKQAGAWRQQAFGVKNTEDDGVAGTWVSGDYAAGKKKAKLTITDLGDVAKTQTPWTGPPVESGGTKTYGEGGRTVREEDKRGGRREVTIVLGNGLAVGASGSNVEMAELKQLAAGVDLARAEALARPAK